MRKGRGIAPERNVIYLNAMILDRSNVPISGWSVLVSQVRAQRLGSKDWLY
jgi:hypothetical protein